MASNRIFWEQVVARSDIAGGDLQTVESEVVYHGRIKSVRIEGDDVVFECEWVARLHPTTHEWEKWDRTTFSESRQGWAIDLGSGRIFFRMAHGGYATIFPKGDAPLDPERVKGLVVTVQQPAEKVRCQSGFAAC
jgi:hypothetical protein